MPLRFNCKACAIATAGTTFTHGLTGPLGSPNQAPDEWKFDLRGPSPGAVSLYLVGTPTSMSFVVAASGAAATGDIFANINSSFIK